MNADLPTFEARVSREDNLWVIVIDGPLPAGAIAVTDTPHFAEVAVETRDLISDLTDLDEDRFWVRYEYKVNGRDVTADLLQYQGAERDYRETSAKQLDARSDRRSIPPPRGEGVGGVGSPCPPRSSARRRSRGRPVDGRDGPGFLDSGS